MAWHENLCFVLHIQWICLFSFTQSDKRTVREISLIRSDSAMTIPSPPTNLTLAQILANTVMVTWEANSADKISHFEMTIQPVVSTKSQMIADVDGQFRSFQVPSLYPETEYQLYMNAYNEEGRSNDSDIITFQTMSVSADDYQKALDVHPGEVLIVAILLVAWFCAIALFLRKWGKIRIIQSGEPRYKHVYKNLDTIKVVKRPTDSVIYKSQSRQMSKTMVAREKRLARMNTMPNIKVNIPVETSLDPSKATENGERKIKPKEQHKYKVFSRTITSPVLEVDESTAA